ncbi:MAG: hypothetical protein J0H56_12915 [Micrococcales bacterium]|nr:hypothetical protein [Micrococcales bacterium]
MDASSYDYDGQAAWNRDAGLLWDRTRRRLRDRWDSLEYFIVREWQDRGVLHVHVIVRIARFEAPEDTWLRKAARTATAFSMVDGCLVEWGAQARCDAFTADGDGAKTIWYLSKALNYVMKDVALVGRSPHSAVVSHQARLAAAARRMRCGRECVPANCPAKLHDRYGARSQVVSASRRTKHRTGWSFSGLTRTVQRQLRLAWFLAKSSETPAEPEETVSAAVVVGAQEGHAARLRLELASLAASGP